MKYIKPIIAGVSCMLICVLLMTAVNLIPRERIQKKSEESASYLHDVELFHYTRDDYVNSEQDNYADAKWMGIVYSIDTKHPFTSAIWARYAQLPYENIDDGFFKQVNGEEDVNQTYSRYWHGAMTLIRPILVFTDLQGIRTIFGVVIVILQILILVILWRMHGYTLAGCYLLAFLAIHPWMFFKSLEYSMVFLVASEASVIMLYLLKTDRTDNAIAFFTATGVLTNFMDFLTIETLTFTIPMLFLLMYLIENDVITDIATGVREMIKYGISWFAGYAGAFATKLLLVYFICGKEELNTAFTVAAERAAGEVYIGSTLSSPTATTAQKFSGAIWHNIIALFPTHAYNMSIQNTILAAGGILLFAVVMIYLFHTDVTMPRIVLPTLLALIPYARYLALSSHSYVHYFFTYRAQLVTLVVLFYMTFEYGIKNMPRFLMPKKGRK